MSFSDPLKLVPAFPVMLLALTVHEWAHAYSAWRLGDPTARALGRMTLNPLAHLDLLGTVSLVLVGFGWARPVPVDARYLSQPRRDMMWIAAAGPLSNLLQAALFGLVVRFGLPDPELPGLAGFLARLVMYGVAINCALAVFNLFPLPPLDGSKIVYGLFPGRLEANIQGLERWGPLVLLALVLSGMVVGFSPLWLFLGPLVDGLIGLFAGGAL